MELTITFSLVRCVCGAERQAGQSCPQCGQEPEEVDADLERRRAIVDVLGERGTPGDLEPLKLDEWIPAIRGWFDAFSAGYEATAEGSVDDAVARLRGSLTEFDGLHARASQARRLRPAHALWRAIDGVLAAFDGVRKTYLNALTAATVDEAEAAAEEGQAAIDAAAAALARFNAVADAWERVEDADPADEHGDLLAGAEAVAALSGLSDMVELDRKGAELFARITGDAVDCPTGFGLRLQLLDLVVDASMDPARFWSSARNVYRLLVEHDVALRGLFSNAEWRAELVALSLEARDAGFEATAVAAAGANRRRMIQSALRLAARQIERVAHPLLATLLALTTRKAYPSERKRDIGALLTRTEQAGRAELLLGLDEKLRDADAHGKFVIDDGGVRLTGSRGGLDYLTDDELIDATIAGTESILALYWGLVAALVASGVGVDELEEAVAAEVAAVDKVKLVLLLNAWHDVEVAIDGADMIARGKRDRENAWSLIGALVPVVPDECETMRLTVEDESGTHTATGLLAPYRRWGGNEDELEKEIAFTLASEAWTVDGAPIMTRAHTEKIYAYRAIEALNPDVAAGAALTRLRALLDAARALESHELATVIATALRLRREVATGAPLTTGVEAVVGGFDPWLLLDLPQLRSSW